MDKIAFLFPGQGAQFVGMSKSIFDQYAIARQTFEEANDVLNMDLSGLCFEGSISDLNKLENMFPAILASSIALFRVYMLEIGLFPQFCAGHSLGEYSALTCSGVLKFSDALKIVRDRGVFAREMVENGNVAMTILDNVDAYAIGEECSKISREGNEVSISCYNSPGQVAISGHIEAVQMVEDKALELNGQVTPLFGGAPFHSPIMRNAAEKLRRELEKYSFGSFRYPVLSNVTGTPYEDGREAVDLLVDQILRPVQWQATMHYIKKFGVTMIVEMSPKNVLSNLVHSNIESVKTICYGQKEDRETLKEYTITAGLKRFIPDFATKCMAAAVATPNKNWDRLEYQTGVIEPFKKIKQIQDHAASQEVMLDLHQMKRSLELLKVIFTTKKVSVQEQREWFSSIIDETATNYLFEDYISTLE